MSEIKYAVLGSGRQGIASAYDLVRCGNASEVQLLDINIDAALSGANRVNTLLKSKKTVGKMIDATNHYDLVESLTDIDVFISAVPYRLNPKITAAAIEAKTSMVDLGGHTDNVLKQLDFHNDAKKLGITIVPDCGMGPGMNITMAMLAMEQMEKPIEVRIWDGGLPQDPKPPWNYNLFFHINGLTNEYDGSAYFLKDGVISKVSCFEDIELLEFPDSIGELEAAVTSGGLSTMPWTFNGKLEVLENKTLRYPGHWEWMKAYRELGLFKQEIITYNDTKISPREFYHNLLEPKLNNGLVKDVCLMRIECRGNHQGEKVKSLVESIEHYDEITGFTAMEKWTGWHASIMAIQIAKNKISSGAYPVEKALSGKDFLEEAKKRNCNIIIKVENLDED